MKKISPLSISILISIFFLVVFAITAGILSSTKNSSEEGNITSKTTRKQMDQTPGQIKKEPESTTEPETTGKEEESTSKKKKKEKNTSTETETIPAKSSNYLYQDLSQEEWEEKFKDQINFYAAHPYKIMVNRIANCVTVYGLSYDGAYDVPCLAFLCSVADPYTSTPTGTYYTSDKYEWHQMVDGTYAQYSTRITGHILFHSVCYSSTNKDTLITEEFNDLGSPASLGCIRLCVRDAKWIYDNCPAGTQVVIYDDLSSAGELGVPSLGTISLDSPYAGWDPTDPDPENPWNTTSKEKE